MKNIPSKPNHRAGFIPKESIGRPQAARLSAVVRNQGVRNTKKPKGMRGS